MRLCEIVLNPSEITIVLRYSRDYVKCTAVLFCVTAGVLLSSGLPWVVKMTFLCILLLQFSQIYSNPKPAPSFTSILLKNEGWVIEKQWKEALSFDKATILLDTGLFQLISFSGSEARKRHILVFKDQLYPSEYYALQRKLHLK